jgi:hypothetical protein
LMLLNCCSINIKKSGHQLLPANPLPPLTQFQNQ